MLKYTTLALIAIAIAAVLFLGRSCAGTTEVKGLNRDSVLNVIAEGQRQRNILLAQAELNKAKADKMDSVTKKVIIKYRYLRANRDSLPCDTVLKLVTQACDTIIKNDSTEKHHLRLANTDLTNANLKADTMLGNYKKVVRSDSLMIVGLRKEVKKQKRQKWLITALWAIKEGLGFVK